MKRMSVNTNKVHSNVMYKPINSDESASTATTTLKKKRCPSSIYGKKMYILLILMAIVLIWIFIYYKLLNHRFELPEPLRQLRKMFGDGEVKKRHGREEETENIIPSTKTPCLLQFQNGRNIEVIHIAIVGCNDRVEDALVNMKTMTLFTNYNIWFHIFTDKKHIAKKTFDTVLKTWPAWIQQWMMFTIHPIYYPTSVDHDEWSRLFKPCASQRLFLASILVDVDVVIYVDTDILFLDAPENLWNIFKSFNKSHIGALTYECEDKQNCWYNDALLHPYFEPHGLNSGVMLMNLTRMRKLKWETELVKIYSLYKKQLVYGDQDILNIYFQLHRKRLYRLPCYWNYRPDHCIHGNTCSEADNIGISAIHGNRQVFKKKHLQPEFYFMYEAFRNYKFSESFEEVVVNGTKDLFRSEELLSSSCGKMMDAFMKHISCTNR